MVQMFKQACSLMGLPRDICLYQLRHGGASEDFLSRDRDSMEVKARGRWTTDMSLRRYAKPAQLQHLIARLSALKVAFAQTCLRRLGDLAFQRWVPGLV